MKVGAQLYTLHIKTLDEFATALDRVAEMGYTTVQVSGTCAYSPEWLAEQLKRTGLTCDLTHTSFDRMTAETEKVIDEHKQFGCKYIGVGSMPGFLGHGIADFVRFVDKGLPASKLMRDHGAMMMYHNHAVEYENTFMGKSYIDLLAEAFPKDCLGFTLDTYWVQYGKADPVEEIKKLKGRLPCIHFKDMEILSDGTRRYCPIGAGVLHFDKIIAALEEAGTAFGYVEQDDCFGKDPYLCLKQSYDYLHSFGLD